MNKVLIFTAYYYPGFRSGGPQQSIMNLVDIFGSKCDFSIYTHNHDMGVSEPYTGVVADEWNRVGKARVLYSSKEKYTLRSLRNIAKDYDVIYLCEPYHQYTYSILLLKRIGLISAEVMLAPMGAFTKGALNQKSLKKKVYWNTFKMTGISQKITWSFTSELEKKDAEQLLGLRRVSNYFIAEDLPRRYVNYKSEIEKSNKIYGEIKLIFLSRICEMKNLLYALKIVAKFQSKIIFDIYGTIEDEYYWGKCKEVMNTLPDNIKCFYKGIVASEKVIDTIIQYDGFILPTRGENFGHAIYESLMAGCVPMISNNTPWGEIEEYGCGAVISLENEDGWVNSLERYINMDNDQFSKVKIKAMEFAKAKYQNSIETSGYRRLLGENDNAIDY